MNRYLILLIFITSSIFGETIHRGKVVEANNSMVVTRHFLATEIGNNVLQNGGNAIDASIAISFALAVVLPQAGNIGGGGFMVFFVKPENKLYLTKQLNKLNGEVINFNFTKKGVENWTLA